MLPHDIIIRYVQEINKFEGEFFEYYLRNVAKPPIKGNITKRKIKLRGITMCEYHDGTRNVKWIEQRGKQISPKMILTYHVNSGRYILSTD